MKKLRLLFDLIEKTGKHFQETAISAYAGQSAFFIMLSFFPFLILLLSFLQYTPLNQEIVTSFILSVVPRSFHQLFLSVIQEIYEYHRTGLISITLISTLWMSSKALLSLVQGLNSMYRIEENRNYFVLRFFSILYSIAFVILIILTLILLVFGNQLKLHISTYLHNSAIVREYFALSPSITLLVILFVFFLLMYKILPSQKKCFWLQIPGAFIAAIGWLIFSNLYGIYVDNFSNYATFYGTMATIALLMVWIYLCMYLLFLGGILNHAFETGQFSSKKRK